MANSKLSAQEQVEEALFALLKTAHSYGPLKDDELRGYVLGFLQNYPAIHNALAARDLLKGRT